MNEVLARAIHEEFLRREFTKGESAARNPSLVEWGSLPEMLKGSNRDQAAHVGTKLQAIGCDLKSVSEPDELTPVAFPPSEVERLAEMEHDRWWKERRAEGWTLGHEKDIDRKKSPYLIPWTELSEEIREKDRSTGSQPAGVRGQGRIRDRPARAVPDVESSGNRHYARVKDVAATAPLTSF